MPTSSRLLCLVALLMGCGMTTGCNCGEPASETPPEEPTAEGEPPEVEDAPEAPETPDDSDYGQELARLSAQVRAHEHSVATYDNDWGRLERLAEAYAARAKLTGNYEDYQAADRTVARAFEMAPEGTGPFVVGAHLHYTLHRLAQASEALDRAEAAVMTTPSIIEMISVIRADIAFHRGEFAAAEAGHRAQDEARPSNASAFRVAYDLWQSGRFNEAEQWLSTAASRVPDSDPRTQAWMNIQKGLIDLDRGRCADALAHYREAETLFSGWWLVEEHIAEALACTGELEEAETLYRDVVERTNNPELIDALADLLEERGEAEEAATFRARATARFEEQLEQLPEAAYGHALEHFLAHGTPERSLELAEANYEMRPGAEATIRLTQALLRSGRAEDALARITPLLATPFRSAEMHATAAVAYRANGDEENGASQEALAVAIHPEIMEDVAGFAPSEE
ncbi:MAG: tetratricopeptide repeat protein [Sandaracinaceae bacterium]